MSGYAVVNGIFSYINTDSDSFDPRKFDYASVVMPQGTLTDITTTTDGYNRYQINATNGDLINKHVVYGRNANQIKFINASLGSSAGFRNVPTAITDCDLEVPIRTSLYQTPVGRINLTRVHIHNNFASQDAMGSLSGAVSGLLGSIKDSFIEPSIDSIQGPNGISDFNTIDRTWLKSPHTYPLTDGYPWNGTTTFPLDPSATGLSATTGDYLTDAQQLEAGTTQWPANTYVNAGQLFVVSVSATYGEYTIQCVQSGMSGTGTLEHPTVQTDGAAGGVQEINGFPMRLKDYPAGTEPSFILQGGTARFVVVGVRAHSDGVQFVNGGNLIVTRSRIENPSNDCFLIQSVAGNLPAKSVYVDQTYMKTGTDAAASTHMIQVNSANQSAQGTSTGGYIWNTDGTWTTNTGTALGRSRPWFVSFTRCWFEDLPGTGAPPTMVQCMQASSVYGDVAIFVNSEAVRDAGVAAQYGITVSQAQAMRLQPDFDWASFASSNPVNQSLLSSRLATFHSAVTIPGKVYGAHASKCDARTWIVWSENRSATAETVYVPTQAGWPSSVSGFDANGYYIGG